MNASDGGSASRYSVAGGVTSASTLPASSSSETRSPTPRSGHAEPSRATLRPAAVARRGNRPSAVQRAQLVPGRRDRVSLHRSRPAPAHVETVRCRSPDAPSSGHVHRPHAGRSCDPRRQRDLAHCVTLPVAARGRLIADLDASPSSTLRRLDGKSTVGFMRSETDVWRAPKNEIAFVRSPVGSTPR